MKKIFVIMTLLGALLLGGFSADAKTTRKTSTRPKTAAAANITVAKNYAGYPDPTGHTYKTTGNGVTVILEFDNPYSLTFTTIAGRDKAVQSIGWEQNGFQIQASDVYLEISEDGKSLLDPSSGAVCKIVK